jgi:hypothetical protein
VVVARGVRLGERLGGGTGRGGPWRRPALGRPHGAVDLGGRGTRGSRGILSPVRSPSLRRRCLHGVEPCRPAVGQVVGKAG